MSITNRKQALNRVRAGFANYRDIEASGGTYQTDDIKQLLETIEEREQVLAVVIGDLEDLKKASDDSGLNGDFSDMIASTLLFLRGYEV